MGPQSRFIFELDYLVESKPFSKCFKVRNQETRWGFLKKITGGDKYHDTVPFYTFLGPSRLRSQEILEYAVYFFLIYGIKDVLQLTVGKV
jgi:hypothetical protein